MSYIRSFQSLGRDDIATAGGKGANLGEMVQAGFPIPPGFVLSTAAYDAFVREHGLQPAILELASKVRADDPQSGSEASTAIAALFLAADVSDAIRDDLLAAYAGLASEGGDPPALAVRSSATAEDLPGASFAGQQETLLNVRGGEALIEAVQRCWASLWTDRAMSYRLEQGIAPGDVSLAVVVQQLVPAESSGILFTANPLDGRRDQVVINASWGLGEAIVGGQVTPDTVIVDKGEGTVVTRETADKAVMTVRTETGSEERAVPSELRDRPVLDDAAAAELMALAQRIEALYGRPMDIEWARSEGRFAILQARPITSLPEAGDAALVWEPSIPGSAWMRRQVVEHMPEPLSPLFAELYLEKGLERSLEALIEHMGMDTGLMDEVLPAPHFDTVHGFAYMRFDYKVSVRSVALILKVYATVVPRFFRTGIAYWRDDQLPAYLAKVEGWKRPDLGETSDERLIEGLAELAEADAVYWFAANFPLALSKVTDGLLERFLRSLKPVRARADAQPDAAPLSSGPFLRGYPSKTLDAQVALSDVADQIAADPLLRARVLDGPAGALRSALGEAPSGGPALEAVERYLDDYGHQIYNLDFAVPTLAEDPLPVLVGLQGLLAHPERDARARQAEFLAERQRLTDETAGRLGPIRRRIFRKVLAWAQRHAPYREDALYYVGAAWPTLRRLALELGTRLVDAGTLDAPDEVFYLNSQELRQAAAARSEGRPRDDLGRLAGQRQALRESRKALLPPPTVPIDYRFKLGPFDLSSALQPKSNIAEGDVMEGFAVSPGRVTAPASVILSPADFEKMRPDSILVCPTTTPAWTPLFTQARGLVTDIGGVLAHGSIVAREYGIPAVMGTTVATTRIRDGQMLTLDGTAGTVEIVEPEPMSPLPEPAAPQALALQESWELPEPGMKLIRRQIVEHMPGPLSPLFDELYLRESMDRSIDTFLEGFGMGGFEVERHIPRPFFITHRGYAFARADYRVGSPLQLGRALLQILPAYFKMLPTLLRHAVERWRDEKVPAYQAVIDEWAALDPATESDDRLWAGIRALSAADAIYWFEVSIILGLSKVTDGLFDRSLRKLGPERNLSSGQFLRGFDSKTMDAQASLEAISAQLRGSPELRRLVAETAVADLRAALEQHPEAAAAQAALERHIEAFGHQIYSLDFAEPTQGEDLLPILVSLAALVEAPADSRARQAELARERDALVTSTAASFGAFRRWRFRKLLGLAQKYAPYRESALFYIGAGWPTLRSLARELGERLAESGAIAQADDLYFLRIEELEAALRARAAGEPLPDYASPVRERRALREARKALSPPAKIPDEAYKFGPIDMSIFETQKQQGEGDDLKGFGVSPGRVTAPAMVLRSPADFEKMRPGHILVCPTTTPAWTPLFSQAAGLVTEIGSILAHGSIVAREYGIPAVMGLERATERIRDGQRITVDGDQGLVAIEEDLA